MAIQPPIIVNILSTSYAGSTWLNLMLGSHPRAFSVGELPNIDRLGGAVCRLHGEKCPVWSCFDAEAAQNIYQQIQRICGGRVLVLNNPRRYLDQQPASGFDVKYIHLVRDGRAVAASIRRKYPRTPMWRASRQWRASVRKNLSLLDALPPEDVTQVRYEDLMADGEAQLRRVCAFLGLAYDPGMWAYWNTDHCFLGGSRGTLFALARRRGGRITVPSDAKHAHAEFDRAFYERTSPDRFADERWREELTPGQLRVFALVAGRLNRRFGYPAGWPRG